MKFITDGLKSFSEKQSRVAWQCLCDDLADGAATIGSGSILRNGVSYRMEVRRGKRLLFKWDTRKAEWVKGW